MAVKKNPEEDPAERAAAPEVPYDPWEEMVPVTLPRDRTTDETAQYACVNGRKFQVPRGVTVKVPRPVYDILMQAEEAREKSELRKSALHAKYMQASRYL